MMRVLFGLHGLPGVGKDTIADHLVAHHNFAKVAFADTLKEELAEAFPLSTPEMFNGRTEKTTPYSELSYANCVDRNFILFMLSQVADGKMDRYDANDKHTPRWAMQYFGDYRRDRMQNYLIHRLANKVSLLPAEVNVCITDVRFKNEADFVLSNTRFERVQLIEVVRPVNPFAEGNEHLSNRRLHLGLQAYRLLNGGTSLARLQQDIDTLIEECQR